VSGKAEKIYFIFSLLTLPLIFLVVYGVIMRYFLKMPDVRAFFMAVWLYGSLAVLGASYTLYRRGHVSFDLIYQKLRPKARKMLDIIDLFVVFVVSLIIIAVSIPFAWNSFLINERDSSLGLLYSPPIWWYKWLGVFAVGILAIQAVLMIVEVLRKK
jgi:TRAP-type mannitol/chloroaromatic compound transport system permease small subunit